MAFEKRNVDRYMEVGSVVMLHTDVTRKDGPRYRTVVRGWRKGGHVMLDRPKTDAGSFSTLQEGQECVIRFIHEGMACAYNAHVIDWDTRRHNPYLRITWPRELQYISFRRHERLKVQLPCRITLANGDPSSGEIRDMSLGGFGAQISDHCEDGAIIMLDFELPDGTSVHGAKALVKSCRETDGGYFLGCEFQQDSGHASSDIDFYITSTMERRRAEQTDQKAAPRIVIIEQEEAMAARLKSSFEKRGFEVIIATNTIDAFYRIRMTLPLGVVVSQTQSDLPGLVICRLIKSHRDLENLPVYLYGGDEAELAQKAHAIHANGYFAPCVSLAPDIAFEVGEELKRLRAGHTTSARA
jgi:c-di-GMP-binding flagellar brake protein YcgR